jgi:predicted TIM-barrel enzyme
LHSLYQIYGHLSSKTELFRLRPTRKLARNNLEGDDGVNNDLILLCQGGPFDEPENVGEALKRMPGIHGFFGASSIERLPTERAIRSQVESFIKLRLA